METEKVLSEFEKLTDTLATATDPDLWRKLLNVIDVYPFPELTRPQRWRLNIVRDQVIGRIERGVAPKVAD